MITYFIPVYNESTKNKETFNLFLKKIKKEIIKNNNHRFIIVDDGSTDDSSSLLKNLIKINKVKKKVLFLKNSKNKGIGYSFIKSLKYCKTKFICPIPSDNDLPFINPEKFLKKKIDHLIFFPENSEKYSLARFILSVLFRLIYNITFDLRVNYIQGSFISNVKFIRKLTIVSKRFTFWAEINVKLLRTGLRYSEYPLYFKNPSKIDRTVSIKNFFEIVVSYFKIVFEIYYLNKKKFCKKPVKVY
jgi:glycosyltransferase involved in cell wall biosynthesis